MTIDISIDGRVRSFASFRSVAPDLAAAEARLQRESQRRKLSYTQRFAILHPPARLILYTAREATELEIPGWVPEYGVPFRLDGRPTKGFPRQYEIHFRKEHPVCLTGRMLAPRPLTLDEAQLLAAASEHRDVLAKLADQIPALIDRSEKSGEEIREEALRIVKDIRKTDAAAATVVAEYMDGGTVRSAAKAAKVSLGRVSQILNEIQRKYGIRLIRHRRGKPADTALADTHLHDGRRRPNPKRRA